MSQQLLETFGSQVYYAVDTNMLYAYCNQPWRVPGWREYVDNLSRNGVHFFVTPTIQREWGGRYLPSPFRRVNFSEAITNRIESAYHEFCAVLAASGLLNAPLAQFNMDLHWILESGFLATIHDLIPLEALDHGRIFAVTLNAKLVRYILATPGVSKILEQILAKYSLGVLIDVRFIKMYTTEFRDYLSTRSNERETARKFLLQVQF